MILVVGLGNPGAKYKNTYHNVGFEVADALARKLGGKFSKDACDSKIAECKKAGVIVAKPQTYMNLSGEAVKKLVRAYDVDETSELIVCYDDVDLPLGKLRLREEGSAGTHNGMRNIVLELGTQNFFRLRVGTRTPELAGGQIALLDFVLSKIDYKYQGDIKAAVDGGAVALAELISGAPLCRVQEKLNRR
ncbi:MAG: aminoacyl-tRNA hydrolase [Bacteroides sp.]|nr:aminoacyl-tRNA hydrolase [Bacillota bacterium]MCM1394104.1 aminoacyl-tRNA hydrolase [[Eubacterium] siraeum]MCM1455883.1 aminoacyl-tRNA hydrolase [Bacteroides sp.]